MSDVDSREGSPIPYSYSPHVEYSNPSETHSPNPLSQEFLNRFSTNVRPTYPSDVINTLELAHYDPYMIGYSHASAGEVPAIISRLKEILHDSNEVLKVAHEIDPQQLQWIKDFIEAEREYIRAGTIGGDKPAVDETTRMREYRERLMSNHSEHIALWLLENGVEVVSIEHPEVQNWIRSDKGVEEDSFSGRGDPMQPMRTAIKRDTHGLEVMASERPGIVVTGANHTIKFDLLMNRDGHRSYLYLDQPVNWNLLIDRWEAVHDVNDRNFT